MNEILERSMAEVATTLATFILTVAVPYGLALLRSWVKARTAAVQDAQLREGLEWAFDRLDKTASTVVAEIEQTLKKHEKKISSAQKLAAAVRRTNLRLPAEAMQRLQQTYTPHDIEKIVLGKIEAKVSALR